MINGFGCIFRAFSSGLKNSADVLLLSAGSLAEDGKLLSLNGFHIENCWSFLLRTQWLVRREREIWVICYQTQVKRAPLQASKNDEALIDELSRAGEYVSSTKR
jgi:hypothetical protein